MNTDLTERLRELKMLRKIIKSLWKRAHLATSSQPTQVEYPAELELSLVEHMVTPILTSIGVTHAQITYTPSKHMTAGVRVFHDGRILDVSLDTIETKLLSSF